MPIEWSQFGPKILWQNFHQLSKKFKASGSGYCFLIWRLALRRLPNVWESSIWCAFVFAAGQKTSFKDEKIFIIYHQITELFSNWLSSEMEQIQIRTPWEAFFIERMERIMMYFDHLISPLRWCGKVLSEIQFLKFRMSCFHPVGFKVLNTEKSNWWQQDAFNLVALQFRAEADYHSPSDDLFSAFVLAARSDRMALVRKLWRWK